jgi:hypothetical protein
MDIRGTECYAASASHCTLSYHCLGALLSTILGRLWHHVLVPVSLLVARLWTLDFAFRHCCLCCSGNVAASIKLGGNCTVTLYRNCEGTFKARAQRTAMASTKDSTGWP